MLALYYWESDPIFAYFYILSLFIIYLNAV